MGYKRYLTSMVLRLKNLFNKGSKESVGSCCGQKLDPLANSAHEGQELKRTRLKKWFISFACAIAFSTSNPSLKKTSLGLQFEGAQHVLALDDSEYSLETLKKELITVLEEIVDVQNELQDLKNKRDKLIQNMLTREFFQSFIESGDEFYNYIGKHMNFYLKGLQNEIVVLMEKLATLKVKEQDLTERINSLS